MGLNCDKGFEKIQTEIESKPQVSYKIVYTQKEYGAESFEFSQGIIVVKDINSQTTQNEIVQIIGRIGVKNNLTKIIALRNCDAGELYLQQTKLTSEQKNYLNENLIVEMDIDLLKSLSKKEKKKHKKKRDLIESVSKESCIKLTEFGNNKLSKESFNQIVSSTSAKYAEKTMKVYDLSFEESVDKFLKDLMNHLLSDCQTVKEFVKNN